MIWVYVFLSVLFSGLVGIVIREFYIIKARLQWLDYLKKCLDTGAMTCTEIEFALDRFNEVSECEMLLKFWRPIMSFFK